jgi:hypothetical protein
MRQAERQITNEKPNRRIILGTALSARAWADDPREAALEADRRAQAQMAEQAQAQEQTPTVDPQVEAARIIANAEIRAAEIKAQTAQQIAAQQAAAERAQYERWKKRQRWQALGQALQGLGNSLQNTSRPQPVYLCRPCR